MTQPLSLRLPEGIRFFPHPLPAVPSATSLRRAYLGRRTTGLPRSTDESWMVKALPLRRWLRQRRQGKGDTPVPGHVPFGSSLSAPLACWISRRLSAVHLCEPCHPPWPPTALALAVVGLSHEKPGHPGWVRLRCPKSFAPPGHPGRTSW